MDVKMPGLDGYETTRAIRALEREHGAPRVAIVALTANALSDDGDASREAGVDEFLAKPFELARLADAIERALASSTNVSLETRAAS
jgi:CheY-like chemotaxis protein